MMSIIRDAIRLCILIALGVWFLGSEVQGAKASEVADSATIKGDDVPLYSGTSSSGKVMKSLRKGDKVTVEVELEGPEGKWCGIIEQGQTAIAGYVSCDLLDRSSQKKVWQHVGSSFSRGADRGGSVNETKVTIVTNQVLVPVTLGYKDRTVEALLVLDTGASITMINTETAARLGIESPETVKGEGQVVGGMIVETAFTKLSNVSVGPHTKRDMIVSIVEEKDLRIKRDGLLGMDFLKGLKYFVDFRNQVINWGS